MSKTLGALCMRRDFAIRSGIYLVQPPYELDLHNFFDFQDLGYSVAERTLLLHWYRSRREGIPSGNPASVTIEFPAPLTADVGPRSA